MELKNFEGFGEVASSTPCGRVATIIDRLSPIERLQPIIPSRRGDFDLMTPYSLAAESDDTHVVQLDLPGVDPGSIKVRCAGHTLKVEAPRKAGRGLAAAGVCNVMYSATVSLPEYVNADAIEISFDNGVLTINGPIDRKRLGEVKVKR